MSDIPVFTLPPEQPRRKQWLRPELLRSWTEFLIVAALAMAIPIRNSTIAALHGSSSRFIDAMFSDHYLLWSITGEAIILALFLGYLGWRGWKPDDLRIRIGWLASFQGLGLLLLGYVAIIATFSILSGWAYSLQSTHHTYSSFLAASSPHLPRQHLHVSWIVIIVAMVINAFMEELICMGYIFNQLAARWNPGIALIGTVFLRMACHTYQDPMHLGAIGALFTLYAAFYWYVRQLWPLIFAHILMDVGVFGLLKLLLG